MKESRPPHYIDAFTGEPLSAAEAERRMREQGTHGIAITKRIEPGRKELRRLYVEMAHAAEDYLNLTRTSDWDRLRDCITKFHAAFPDEDGTDD